MEGGRGLSLLGARISATIARASDQPELSGHANALDLAWQSVVSATESAWSTGQPREALANAVPYMQGFGHTVLAWVWLDVALAVQTSSATKLTASNEGKVGAMRYFYHYELPKTGAWLAVVSSRNSTCADMPEEAF